MGDTAKDRERGERLKAELRANLRRRKAQARGREAGAEGASEAGGPPDTRAKSE